MGEIDVAHRRADHFRRTGYLLCKRIAPATAVSRIRADVNRLLPVDARQDNLERPFRVDQIFGKSAAVREVFTDMQLLDRLSDLLGPNIYLLKNRHNHATVNLPGYDGLRFHRDVLQWSRPIVSAILFLTDSNSETGATRIIPGSQYLPYVGTPNNGGTWMDEHHTFAGLLDQALPVIATAGDVLLFDGLVFHATGSNHTSSDRMIVTMAFRSVDELSDRTSNDTHAVLVRGERLYRGNIPLD